MRAPALLFVTLFASTALAQVDGVVHADPTRGATLLPGSAAYAEGATAGTYNPAGIVHTGTAELFYAHERSIARNQIIDGLWLGLNPFDLMGLGLSVEWIRGNGNDHRKTALTMGFGGEGISAGIAFNWFSDGLIDKAFSVDLGLQTRFSRWFSMGATIKNVDAPVQLGTTLGRRYDFGIGVRPFRERLTIGIDWSLDEVTGVSGSRMAYSLDAMIIDGLHVYAGASHGFNSAAGLYLSLGLRLDTSHFGIGYAISGASQGLNHLAFARLTADKVPALPIRDSVIALVDMNALSEAEGSGTVGGLLGVRPVDRYLRTAALLDRAASDPKLKGVVLKVELSGLGMGRAQELRNAVLKLRANGKTVISLILSCSDQDYLVAAAADHVFAVPEAMLQIDGLKSNVLFFGAAAEKLGVKFDVARVGKYKNSPYLFTRSDMSAEQHEAIDGYLDTDAKVLEEGILASRKITAEQWRTSVDEGLKPTKRAKELGLIDDIVTPDQLEERLDALIPGATLVASYKPFDTQTGRWGFPTRIAVIPVIGNISGGKDSSDLLGLTETAGADSFIRAIEAAANDTQIAAIVVRVDSPGGDGLASDLMYRAVLKAKKKKPVIASMGDVAASGGYYAAMGADEIWASAGTITGSIGVFYLKPAVKDLAEKLGVNQVSISRGELAGTSDLYDPWTDKQRESAQRWIDAFYDSFITEVSASRARPKEEIDAVARGRVWSGEDAKARGLVDQLGGLSDALASARTRAGLGDRDDYDVVIYGGSGGVLSTLLQASVAGRALSTVELATPPPTALQKLAAQLGLAAWQLEPGVKAHLGFSMRVE